MILYTQEDFHAETMRLTNNEGVHVVYDSVGKATFDKSILSLRARGYLVVYGISSGAMPPFDINSLSGFSGTKNKGSLFITRPSLGDYTSTRKDLLWRADDLFNWITNGTLKVNVVGTFPLSEAAKAHELMESRQVAGKIVLLP